MLTQTSETAVQALVYLVLQNTQEPMPPREIADAIGASPTYMAKITRMLVKANILRSHRGALGGVTLSRDAGNITLLEVVEACQGLLIGNYCDGIEGHVEPVCQFHRAMFEVHQATLSILTKWSIKDLASCPYSPEDIPENMGCKMHAALQLLRSRSK
ncbi:MAG: Rrf2 family transcriptional regulator, nitric oxide-sensitive transcriptional repressor [Candidatus Sumerlaeota bacterium]|nr:Rrf2 family transcriptional regulator, nitric oxide-sensitive transcriptional repressor [Candidatus Sumerlaeota bacterium]